MKLRKITAVLAAALLTMTAMTACSGGAASSASSETPSSESPAASAESASSEETTGGDMTGEITVLSREDGSGTRGAFIELFGIEQKNDAGEKEDMTTDDAADYEQHLRYDDHRTGQPEGHRLYLPRLP